MTYDVFIGFVVFVFVSAVTPGPNNTLLMASGLNFGVKRTWPHIAGVALGYSFMLFLAGMGLLSLLNYIPFAYEVLHVLSILYLLYLAFKIATTDHFEKKNVAKKSPMTFWQAVAFQWINPKAIMMSMVTITTYVPEQPESSLLSCVALVTLINVIVCFPCAWIWAAFGSGLRHFLNNPLHFRVFNITMALLLVASLYPMLAQSSVFADYFFNK